MSKALSRLRPDFLSQTPAKTAVPELKTPQSEPSKHSSTQNKINGKKFFWLSLSVGGTLLLIWMFLSVSPTQVRNFFIPGMFMPLFATVTLIFWPVLYVISGSKRLSSWLNIAVAAVLWLKLHDVAFSLWTAALVSFWLIYLELTWRVTHWRKQV